MTRSLRARFAIVALATAVIAVGVVAVAVQGLFERHVERETLAELDADLRFLARSLVLEDGAATLRVQPLPDPRFQEPMSGLYWQVRNDTTGAILRSPSLAGWAFPLDRDALRPGELHRHIIHGPEGTKMIVLERRIEDAVGTFAYYRVAVAVDRKILEAANRAFVLDLLPVMGSVAVGLLAAFALQGAIALRPVERARRALRDLRGGRRERLGRALPSELQGLAAEFDAMLEAQRQSARLARDRAADLAHGLRTPLALLGAKARELRDRGEAEAAAAIEEVTAGIDARITRELARAHIRGPGPSSGPVALAPAVGRIAGALARMATDGATVFRQDVPAELLAPMDEGDLLELLGALLENAAKWARSDVLVVAWMENAAVVLQIEDDGPGIPLQHRRAALTRGVRLDPGRSGNGLGLAIAVDIVRAYGGDLRLEEGVSGGLRVRVMLPWQSGASQTTLARDPSRAA